MRPLASALLLLLALPALGEELRAEAKARIQNLEQHLNDWDIEGARSELAELEKLVPQEVEPLHYFRGRLTFEEGRYQEAVEELERAQVAEKPGSYLKLAKDTRGIVRDHARAESEHFVFFYPAGKDEILAPYALEALESIRSALLQDLGHAPPGKVRVEVVNDANELSKVSTLTKEQIKTTGTIAICKFNKLMVTSPKAVVRGYDWLDTLSHEYVHLVVSQKSRNTVPIWLHEGLAKYLESRWRGKAGQALTPSVLALLGSRVRKNKLVPFEAMHPSIALLPTAEDASTAFAEVFFAVELIHRERGNEGLRAIIEELSRGKDDKRAIETATGKSFAAFEKAWLAYVRRQPFPKELIPMSAHEKKELRDELSAMEKEKKGREISFGDFAEVEEVEARKLAHLGELLRERNRVPAAAEEYGKAHALVGNRYESVSNKYALALLELGRLEEAEKVLLGSLTSHPATASTHVHLGRIHLRRKEWQKARDAYLSALAADPFDPEIHFALFAAHDSLGKKELAERNRKAAARLTGVRPDEVPKYARTLAKDSGNLADPSLPATQASPAPDAGRIVEPPATPTR
ncbi:MAG: tetratricopeptide repeat protein [Myxococcales bacterium]|nr:tetratricopeptide repeat protein [Myxococcales bacterium]